MQHAEKITLLVAQCLATTGLSLKELDAIAVSEGPGSYTGLRIGVNTAKGLCMAKDIPLLAIGSLEVLAHSIETKNESAIIVPMIDARRMEVYTATYDSFINCITPTQAVILDDDFILQFKNDRIHLVGDGFEKAKHILKGENVHFGSTHTSAIYMGKPAYKYYNAEKFSNFLNFSPFYLKSPNITVSKSSTVKS